MKQFLFIMIFCTTWFFDSHAQHSIFPNAYNKATPETVTRRISKIVSLNTTQRQQIFTIYADYISDMRTSHKNMSNNERKTKKSDLNVRISNILSPAQLNLLMGFQERYTPPTHASHKNKKRFTFPEGTHSPNK